MRQLRLWPVLGVLLLWSALSSRTAAVQEVPEYGPAKGTLVIIGGGMTDASGLAQRFIQAAGGPDKKFVIVPTNGGNRSADGTRDAYFLQDDLPPELEKRVTQLKAKY